MKIFSRFGLILVLLFATAALVAGQLPKKDEGKTTPVTSTSSSTTSTATTVSKPTTNAQKRTAKKVPNYSALIYRQNQSILANQEKIRKENESIKAQNDAILKSQTDSATVLGRVDTAVASISTMVKDGFAAVGATLATISVATGFTYNFLWYVLVGLALIGTIVVLLALKKLFFWAKAKYYDDSSATGSLKISSATP